MSLVTSINLDHLHRLTDDTGMLQHARYGLVDRRHGYATDDNARALLFALRVEGTGSRIVAPTDRPRLRELQARYLGFVDHAFDASTGHFRPFLEFDRRWTDDHHSEDTDGRALWALGACAAGSPDPGLRRAAGELFRRALPAAAQLTFPRAWALTLLGIAAYRAAAPDLDAPSLPALERLLAQRLSHQFAERGDEAWPWLEPVLTYDNARLPQALISAGCALGDEALVDSGLRSLGWLHAAQLEGDVFAPVGCDGWYPRGGTKARFDQQPLEAQAMAEACLAALAATGDARWRDAGLVAARWFTGANVLGVAVHDPRSGGGYDGLTAGGVNENMGAESTLAWLHTQLAMHELASAASRR